MAHFSTHRLRQILSCQEETLQWKKIKNCIRVCFGYWSKQNWKSLITLRINLHSISRNIVQSVRSLWALMSWKCFRCCRMHCKRNNFLQQFTPICELVVVAQSLRHWIKDQKVVCLHSSTIKLPWLGLWWRPLIFSSVASCIKVF